MPILSLLHEVKSVESQRHRARKSWVHATAAASAKALPTKLSGAGNCESRCRFSQGAPRQL